MVGLSAKVRLVSGLVLMLFVTGHLANLALGLVSFDAIEAWHPVFMAFWWTSFGDALLWLAAAAHLSLGLFALARRRSLYMRAGDLAQLALGLLIPPLLAIHVLTQRFAAEAIEFAPSYGLTLATYWKIAPALGLQQVAVLVIVWSHACLGLFGWLRLRSWWPRVSLLLYPPVFALPILALLGFVEAGKEVIERFDTDPAWAAMISESGRTLFSVYATLQTWQGWFLTAYAVAAFVALATFAARVVRGLLGHERVRVSYVGGPTVEAPVGLSLLEVSRTHQVPHASLCAGRGRCGVCRVRVLSLNAPLSTPGDVELHRLRKLRAAPDIRLACQAIVAAPAAITVERLVAVEDEEAAALAQSSDVRLAEAAP